MFISGYEILSCNFLKGKWIRLCGRQKKKLAKWSREAGICSWMHLRYFPLVTSSLSQQLEIHLKPKALLCFPSSSLSFKDKLPSWTSWKVSPLLWIPSTPPPPQLTLYLQTQRHQQISEACLIFPDCSAQQATYRGVSIGRGSCKTSSVQTLS